MVISRCIEWGGPKNEHGYGRVYSGGKKEYVHRLAFCYDNGIQLQDIAGQVVMHACDNPSCINPDHLSLGTHKDNMNDMNRKGRGSKGESSGLNKLSEADVIEIRKRYVPRDRTHGTRAMGREYGVSNATISLVISGKTWAHVGG